MTLIMILFYLNDVINNRHGYKCNLSKCEKKENLNF